MAVPVVASAQYYPAPNLAQPYVPQYTPPPVYVLPPAPVYQPPSYATDPNATRCLRPEVVHPYAAVGESLP